MSERGSVLREAQTVINGERQDVYGNPEDSFELIGDLWGRYLQAKGWKTPGRVEGMMEFIEPKDVAMMMTLFKIARECHQHKRDNIIDAAGYLGIYADMEYGGAEESHEAKPWIDKGMPGVDG